MKARIPAGDPRRTTLCGAYRKRNAKRPWEELHTAYDHHRAASEAQARVAAFIAKGGVIQRINYASSSIMAMSLYVNRNDVRTGDVKATRRAGMIKGVFRARIRKALALAS